MGRHGGGIPRTFPWRRVRDSAQVAVVVCPVLLAVNHYDELARGRWAELGPKALLTLLVPFFVSFYTATAAAREAEREARPSGRARTGSDSR